MTCVHKLKFCIHFDSGDDITEVLQNRGQAPLCGEDRSVFEYDPEKIFQVCEDFLCNHPSL